MRLIENGKSARRQPGRGAFYFLKIFLEERVAESSGQSPGMVGLGISRIGITPCSLPRPGSGSAGQEIDRRKRNLVTPVRIWAGLPFTSS